MNSLASSANTILFSYIHQKQFVKSNTFNNFEFQDNLFLMNLLLQSDHLSFSICFMKLVTECTQLMFDRNMWQSQMNFKLPGLILLVDSCALPPQLWIPHLLVYSNQCLLKNHICFSIDLSFISQDVLLGHLDLAFESCEL